MSVLGSGTVGSVLGCLCQVTAESVVRGHPGLCHGIHASCCQGLCWGSRFRVNGICAGLGNKWELAGSVCGQSLPGACFRGHCSLQAGSPWDTAASAREWHCCSGMSGARSGIWTTRPIPQPQFCPFPAPARGYLLTSEQHLPFPRHDPVVWQLSAATPLSALTPCSRNPAELLPFPHSHEGPQGPNPALGDQCGAALAAHEDVQPSSCCFPSCAVPHQEGPQHLSIPWWGCGAPQPGSTDFPNWKKNGMREGGAREGDAFSLFSFWGRTHPAALTKWKKAVRARLVCWAGRQPLSWLQLGQTGGVSHWSRGSGEAPTARAGAPSMLQAWGTRHWGVVVWQCLTPAQRLQWAQCQLGFQVGFLHPV